MIVSWRMPIARSDARAPSSSPVASAGETAVTASARSPSARAASAATSEESTPPENATTALPRSAIRRSSSLERASRARLYEPPSASAQTDLHGPAAAARDRGAVVVLGRDVDDPAVEAPELDPHRFPRRPRRALLAVELVAAQRGETRTPSALVSSRIAAATARSSAGRASAESTMPGRPFFICDGRRPDVERAGREAALDGVRHELGVEVVEIRLEQHDLAGSRPARAVPSSTRRTFGRSGGSSVPAP